jgi:hypothetical protein
MLMSYQDDLKTDSWQKRRLYILERDNWTCQAPSCDKKDKIFDVHHKIYIGDIKPWLYPDDLLITLCKKCHQKEQDRVGLEIHLSNTLKMKGFLVSDLLAFSCKLDTDDIFCTSLLKILRNFQNR